MQKQAEASSGFAKSQEKSTALLEKLFNYGEECEGQLQCQCDTVLEESFMYCDGEPSPLRSDAADDSFAFAAASSA